MVPRRPTCDTAGLMPHLRLLLVDDNPDFRSAAAAYLTAQPQLRLAGQAASGEEALALVAQKRIDLVLLDLAMKGHSGFATTRQLKFLPRAPKVIVVTLQDAPEYRHIAQAVGADGFVSKSEYTTELLPLIARLFPDSFPATLSPAPTLP